MIKILNKILDIDVADNETIYIVVGTTFLAFITSPIIIIEVIFKTIRFWFKRIFKL